jgi:ribonuclease BN (tRNA processing enzyme)
MKLVLLGTGGYYANDRRHTACLMLPDVGVVLDAGTGMFRLGEYLATERLDIFLTHAHLDHIVGLTYLLDVLPPDVLARTQVFGEPAKLAAIDAHLFANELFPVRPAFAMKPLAQTCPLPESGTLRHFPLKHPGGSIGFRLDWPESSLAYVTDTSAEADAPYLDAIRGVDVLVHEAYFDDDDPGMWEVTGHSRLSDVARLAAAADVGLLVLVHVAPQLASDDDFDLDAARKLFPNTHLGSDRMELEF